MSKSKYCNLHCHSGFSLLDGYGSPEAMIKRAAKLGQVAISLTEHGNLNSVLDVKQACEKHGIKFIPGIEFYISPWGKDFDWRPEGGGRRGTGQHLTVWAYNQIGYRNILKLNVLANKMGFFHVPRINYEMLEQYNEGLIATSGCMASAVCQALNPETGVRSSDYRLVNEVFGFMSDVFGKDRYYIELQDHDIPELREINHELSMVNKHYGLEYITTNDSHYPTSGDAESQAAVMCVSFKGSILNPSKFVQGYLDHPGYYLTSYDEMTHKEYGFNVPGSAFTNTMKVAEMVEPILVGYEPEVKKYRFPIMPEYKHDYDGELEERVRLGFIQRYGGLSREDLLYEESNNRIGHELSVVRNLGFASYFLCIYDIKLFCDEQAIPMTVRGSAGGSIILYCLGVTDFCPLKYNLIFERFLNPDRISAPDADLDIAPSKRAEVIRYIMDKYGSDFVAQVFTFNFIKGRSAIRDATRILEHPIEVAETMISKMFDHPNVTVAKTGDEKSDMYVVDFVNNKVEGEVFDLARRLEGQIRHTGIHAGAVMVSDRPLVLDYPMARNKKGITPLAVSINYNQAEELGGIKIDVLGVEALGILYQAMEIINDRHGTKYRFDTIPVDDPASYELINSGRLSEIFQLSGHAGRKSAALIKPQNVKDVMVVSSICRPGPNAYEQLYADRMHGKVPVEYPHPDLEDILRETQGIMLFQENVMKASQIIAGFTMAQADILRKAISKKKGFQKIKAMFMEGGKERGYTDDFIESIWADMREFSGYGFNMPHACAYSRISVKQAYLKAKYPIEYYAAALTGRIDNKPKLIELMTECGACGIEILPPKLGNSDMSAFTIDNSDSAIRFPFTAVRDVGKGSKNLVGLDLTSIESINTQHLKRFKKTGKRALESLAFVGAFDHLFSSRNAAIDAVPYLAKGIAPVKQMSLIEEDEDLYSEAEFLAFERNLTGLYLTGHPLNDYPLSQPEFSDQKTYEGMHNELGVFVGVVNDIKLHRDKGGNLMAFVTIEDKTYDEISVVVFASLYHIVQERICRGCVIKVLGQINVRYGDTPEEDQKIAKYGRVSIVAKNIIGEQ